MLVFALVDRWVGGSVVQLEHDLVAMSAVAWACLRVVDWVATKVDELAFSSVA